MLGLLQLVISAIIVGIGVLLTYPLTKLYLKLNSRRIKDEFSWFGGKTHRKILKKYGLR